MGKDPAFPWYASDWLGSNRRAMMTLEQQAAYMNLLCRQWTDKTCSLPDDDDVLAQLSELNEGWLKGGCQVLRHCFPKHPTLEGRIANPKLLLVRDERDEWRRKSQEGGRKSAAVRRAKAKSKRTSGARRVVTPPYEPNANQTPTKGQPNANSPSPSPSPSHIGKTPLNPPRGKSGFDPLKVELPDGLDTPAFRVAWADWVSHRKEIRKKLTPTSVARQLKALAAMGVDSGIEMIEHTIEKGWVGLEPKQTKRGGGQPTPSSPPLPDVTGRRP